MKDLSVTYFTPPPSFRKLTTALAAGLVALTLPPESMLAQTVQIATLSTKFERNMVAGPKVEWVNQYDGVRKVPLRLMRSLEELKNNANALATGLYSNDQEARLDDATTFY